MSYKSLSDCLNDLERTQQLVRINTEVDPNLEMAEITRRIFDKQGPAILFENVKGSPFQAVSNVYGTIERTDFIFRDTIKSVQKIIDLKIDPTRFFKNPIKYLGAPFTALTALPKKGIFKAASMYGLTTIDQLPQVKSWPMDGGAFITLPQVFSLPPNESGIMKSNIGMYRIQLSGNDYIQNKEIGLHYQIHRGIGNHHQMYNQSDAPFRVSIFVGGPPSHTFSAIMPLPEGMSELTFAGLLGGRRFKYARHQGHVISADADFVITGTIRKDIKKSEGPFGDHLGYYSLAHDFPVMEVENVFHRKNAIWQFTVVGRPPQEDSSFGYLIHELVKDLTSEEFPGIKDIKAVDEAGVHPLLLAIGSERYMPFRTVQQPEEILTQANHILGKGQTSLAKFLIIANGSNHKSLNTKNIPAFFEYCLQRINLERDLHFQTKTTIDTLDYSGTNWNEGSKLIMAINGPVLRNLGTEVPINLRLPKFIKKAVVAGKGILALQANAEENQEDTAERINELSRLLSTQDLKNFPLIVLCDDAEFLGERFENFLWVTFTRANPSHDVHGVESFQINKHWGCKGSLIIDARIKPHHAPPLIADKKVSDKVDELFKNNSVLAKWG